MTEIEPPPDALKELFAAEKAAPVVNASTHVTLRARFAAAVGRTPLGHAVAGGVLGGAGKALAIIALTVAAGTGTVVALTRGRTSEAAKPAAQVQSHDSVGTTPSAAPQPEAKHPAPVEEVESAQSASTPKPIAATRPPIHPATGPSEPDLLARARAVLSAGNADVALQIVEQDAQLHPDGALGEEREAVRISALVKLHRMDEARSAAARFIQEHPTSVHRALVERAIQSEESP